MANDLRSRPSGPEADKNPQRKMRMTMGARDKFSIHNKIGNGGIAARNRALNHAGAPTISLPGGKRAGGGASAGSGAGGSAAGGHSGGSAGAGAGGNGGGGGASSPSGASGNNDGNGGSARDRLESMPAVGVPGTPDGPPINHDAMPRTGVPGTADGPPLEGGDGGGSNMSPMAQQIRDQENSAASGKPQLDMSNTPFAGKQRDADPYLRQSGKSGDNDKATNDKLNAFGADVRKKLQDKEAESGGNFYKPDILDKPFQSIKARIKKKTAAWIICSIVIGGAGGAAGFATVEGPLEFLQQGALLSQFHLDPQNDQGNSRLLKIARHLANRNKPVERTRMGRVGNKIADKIEAKMNSYGVKSVYDKKGKFLGYEIDFEKTSGPDWEDILKNHPQNDRVSFMKDIYNINVVERNGKLFAPASNSYFADKRLMKSTLRFSGYKHATALQARFMGVRAGVGFHPIKKMNEKYRTLDEKFNAWFKERASRMKIGSRLFGVAAEAGKDKNGNPVDTGDVGSINDQLGQLEQEANAGLQNGDTAGLDKLKTFMESGIVSKGNLFLTLACTAVAIFSKIDEYNFTNVILPEMKLGMERVTVAEQIKDGKTVDEQQVGFLARFNQDKKTKKVWSDARSIQAELHQPLSGPDIPKSAKVDPRGNVMGQFFSQVHLDGICDALTSGPIGFTILLVSGVVMPVQTIISTIVGGYFIDQFVDLVGRYLANDAVSLLAAGPDAGNIWNYGVRLAANDVATSRGGLPLSKKDHRLIADATRADQQLEFSRQPLVARLFDAENPNSFMGQVLMKQSSDPGVNASRMATGLLNVGRSFGTTLVSPFMKTAGAQAWQEYDYGFPGSGFTIGEMNDPNLEDPLDNAEKVVDILDANASTTGADNYVTRAKTCFGIDLVKNNVSDPNGAQHEEWAIKPPVTNQIPLMKDVVDPANKCMEGHPYSDTTADAGGTDLASDMKPVAAATADWTRIRMFIFDSQMMNATACLDGDEDQDPDIKQACIDTGMEPDPTANSSGSNGGGVTGPANLSMIPPTAKILAHLDYNTGDFSQWGTTFGHCPPTTDFNIDKTIMRSPDSVASARYMVSGFCNNIQGSGGASRRAEYSSRAQEAATMTHEGDERWYYFSLRPAPDMPTPTHNYFLVEQWHPEGDGSPAMSINFHSSGTVDIGEDHKLILGDLHKGVWTDYVLHVKFSRTAGPNGWIEGWENGTQKIQKTPFAALTDASNFMKEGIYSSPQEGNIKQEVWHDGMTVWGP